MFDRYVPREVLARITSPDASEREAASTLWMQKRVTTVLYIDIKGFKGIVERLTSTQSIQLMELYYTNCCQVPAASFVMCRPPASLRVALLL